MAHDPGRSFALGPKNSLFFIPGDFMSKLSVEARSC